MAFANQDAHLEELARTGYLYAQIYHSMGLGKPSSARVVITDQQLAPR